MFIRMILFYQKYLSILKPRCCRFYPSCSEYALLQFSKRNCFLAFISSAWRILRCNPYNEGGIDYVRVRKKPIISFKKEASIKTIRFFYVPCSESSFYLIKALDKIEKV